MSPAGVGGAVDKMPQIDPPQFLRINIVEVTLVPCLLPEDFEYVARRFSWIAIFELADELDIVI